MNFFYSIKCDVLNSEKLKAKIFAIYKIDLQLYKFDEAC